MGGRGSWTDEYDVVNLKNDYFIYQRDSEQYRSIVPERPFEFTSTDVTLDELERNQNGDTNYLPVIISIGSVGFIFALSVIVIRRTSRT